MPTARVCEGWNLAAVYIQKKYIFLIYYKSMLVFHILNLQK